MMPIEDYLLSNGFEKSYNKALPHQIAYQYENCILSENFTFFAEGKEGDLIEIGIPIDSLPRIESLLIGLFGLKKHQGPNIRTLRDAWEADYKDECPFEEFKEKHSFCFTCQSIIDVGEVCVCYAR